MSKLSQVYLALGTNLGWRRENLQRAVDALGEVMAIDAISVLFETEPWGVTDQPDFLNACLRGRTRLEPSLLLQSCKTIEEKIGRQPGVRWGPRLIDIDIIFYDRDVIHQEGLTIPHPRLGERAFVLAPLNDIASDFIHPELHRSIGDLLSEIDDGSVERLPESEGRLRRPSRFAWGVKTYVMGIINATPDSFSGDGLIRNDDWLRLAVDQAKEFARAGADILDIGGESTRPGGEPITADEEVTRVLPAVEAVRKVVDIPISVDTYRAPVAEAALSIGANWVNDVWGLRMDPAIASLVATTGCPLVIMHNRSKPKNVDQEERLGGRYVGVAYADLFADIRRELEESIDVAIEHGVKTEQIVVDPGIGFGKIVDQNLRLIDELHKFVDMGFPILIGPSRKSFIGYTLDLPPENRVEGTAAAAAIAIDRGADVIRVHDVEIMVRIARMTDSIVR